MTRRQRGYALVATLWIVTLLALLASGYHRSARTESRLAGLNRSGAQAFAAAEAGIWLTVERLLVRDDRSAQGMNATLEFAGYAVQVAVESEAGRLNLNLARPELIGNLLSQSGLSDEAATALLDAILDWRDLDGQRREAGAEDADYRRVGYPYGAKDGPFSAVDELRYVHGMTEPVFRHLAPALTVYGQHSGIDPRASGRQALLAVSGADADAVDRYLALRIVNDAADEAALGQEIDRRFLGPAPSDVYRITATAEGIGARRSITAFVEFGGALAAPYTLLAWREATGG